MLVRCLSLIDGLTTIRFLFLNLLNTVDGEKVFFSNIFSDEESFATICCSLLLLLGSVFGVRESHLVVTRRCEDILGLCFTSELLREDLTLDVGVWSNIGDRQGDALTHDFCIEIFTLDLLLYLSRHQFDRVWIRPVSLLVSFALLVPFVVDKVMIVDDDSREVLSQFILEGSIVRVTSCWCCEGIASDVHYIDGSGHC